VFLNATDAQTDNISQLADWLANLPLPCGVMAYNDSRAQTVIDACHMAHLRIPDQIQVIGVDNEEEICENTFPTLTSILPDFEGSGYLAAQLLDRMLKKGMPRKDIVYKYGVKSVVERASTQDLCGGGRLVTQACEFIRLHAGEKINVETVSNALNVSRRTLELRFREIRGEGIAEVLRRKRLERVCQLLKETHRSISDISYNSGFASPTHLKALFKKVYGMTMGEWRSSE
jgi:LacI family transcriptional regulator